MSNWQPSSQKKKGGWFMTAVKAIVEAGKREQEAEKPVGWQVFPPLVLLSSQEAARPVGWQVFPPPVLLSSQEAARPVGWQVFPPLVSSPLSAPQPSQTTEPATAPQLQVVPTPALAGEQQAEQDQAAKHPVLCQD